MAKVFHFDVESLTLTNIGYLARYILSYYNYMFG